MMQFHYPSASSTSSMVERVRTQPGSDYLPERKLPALLRESQYHPIGAQLDRFITGAAELGYARGSPQWTVATAHQRLLRRTRGQAPSRTLPHRHRS